MFFLNICGHMEAEVYDDVDLLLATEHNVKKKQIRECRLV